MKYLARYVVGSAISDQRILSDDGHHVTIIARNYRTGELEILVMTGEEFVRRYLLPPGFHRVRYGGIFTTRYRNETLAHCRKLLGVKEQTPVALSGDVDDEPDDEDRADESEEDEGRGSWDPDQTQAAEPGPTCLRCLMPGMESRGWRSGWESHALLARLADLWQCAITVLLVQPPRVRAGAPSRLEELVWTVTTADVDLLRCEENSRARTLPPQRPARLPQGNDLPTNSPASQRTHLPRPDT